MSGNGFIKTPQYVSYKYNSIQLVGDFPYSIVIRCTLLDPIPVGIRLS